MNTRVINGRKLYNSPNLFLLPRGLFLSQPLKPLHKVAAQSAHSFTGSAQPLPPAPTHPALSSAALAAARAPHQPLCALIRSPPPKIALVSAPPKAKLDSKKPANPRGLRTEDTSGAMGARLLGGDRPYMGPGLRHSCQGVLSAEGRAPVQGDGAVQGPNGGGPSLRTKDKRED